jgi:arginase
MQILLLAVPYDSGQHKKRLGAGPLSLMVPLEEHLISDGHDVRKSEVLITGNPFPTEITTSFEVSRKVSQLIREAKANGEFPVILSGNCNTAVGTLSGLHDGSGVIWFDCHGDYNTPETTVGGFLDGMALSMIAGRSWKSLTASVPGFRPVKEEQIILIGARDFDAVEMTNLSHSPITLITPAMVKQKDQILDEALIPMPSIYLHIDLDVIDPAYVRAKGNSTAGGLKPDDLYAIVGRIRKKYSISAVAFAGYDPSMDPQQKVPEIVKHVMSIIV